MAGLYETVRNICAFIILTTVVNNLLHESEYRKYIRFFAGLVLIILIVNPLFRLLSMDEQLFHNIQMYQLRIDKDELKDELELQGADAFSDVTSQYVDMLNDTLAQIVENQGMYVADCKWEIDMDLQSSGYGNITHVYVKASMSSDIGIYDIRVDEDGNVGIAEDNNSSLSLRSEELSKAVSSYYGIDVDCVEIEVVA